MIRVGVVGVGKMGISHLSILGAHPDVDIAGVCDQTNYVLSVIGKYSGFPTYGSVDSMIAKGNLDAILLATPYPVARSAGSPGRSCGPARLLREAVHHDRGRLPRARRPVP